MVSRRWALSSQGLSSWPNSVLPYPIGWSATAGSQPGPPRRRDVRLVDDVACCSCVHLTGAGGTTGGVMAQVLVVHASWHVSRVGGQA